MLAVLPFTFNAGLILPQPLTLPVHASRASLSAVCSAGPACHILSNERCVLAGRMFDCKKGEVWYACTEPADDPVLTCFLAPDWMHLPDLWICTSSNLSEQSDLSADDGY